MHSPLLLEVPNEITTARLQLRSPRAGDGQVVYEAVAESLTELRAFLASLPWVAAEQSVESSEIFCRTAESNFLSRIDLPFLMFERATGQLVGCVGLHRPVWRTPKLEAGYWCRTSQTRQGFVVEGVTALTQLAFDQLKAVRLEIITDEENESSRVVAERCGFQLEGVLRNERRAPDGVLRNTCVYSRVKA